jgi:hypothetical protein
MEIFCTSASADEETVTAATKSSPFVTEEKCISSSARFRR